MRIRAVLRDSDILAMEAGSRERVLATARKNLDRVVNLGSLLRVMGLGPEARIEMLQTLGSTDLHIWLFQDGDQDVVFMTENESPDGANSLGYRWQ
ncbi:MAG: hypothetical protein ACXADO_10430 [Candidatus Thorarchaeota archaeon]|jgi:hypothetical protein